MESICYFHNLFLTCFKKVIKKFFNSKYTKSKNLFTLRQSHLAKFPAPFSETVIVEKT